MVSVDDFGESNAGAVLDTQQPVSHGWFHFFMGRRLIKMGIELGFVGIELNSVD